uniref:RING-type domain-containing protein n=1 Tax=Strongyloides venezuelensis TaxID=75913 RepID=A0A0K0FWV8_STRVS
MDNTTRITDLEVPLNSQPKSSSPLAGKSRTNKRVSIQFDPNRSIIAAGVSERLLNQPGLENVKLYIEEVKSAYDNAAIQNKEALEKLDMLKKNFCEVKNAYEKENLQLKNSIRMSDCSRVELTQEIKLLKRHLSIKDQCDSEVKQKLDETLELYDKLKEEMEVIEEENSRLKDTVVLLDSYDMKIKEYVDMVSILVQDKEILELRLVGLQKELQKQVQMNYSSKDMEVDVYLCKAKLRQVEKKYNNILRNLDDTNTEKESLENNVKQLRDTIYALEIDLKFFQDQVIDQVKEIEKQRSQLKKFELENKDLNIIINDLKEELTGRERAYLIKESVLQEKLSAITTENKGYIEQIAQEYQNEKEKLLQRHKEQIELLNKKHKETIAENYKKEEIKINAMKKQFNEQLDIVAIAATSRSEDKIKELKNQVKEHEITIHNLKNENRGILEEKHIIESELKDAEEIYTQTLQGKISECSELSK